MTGSEFSTFTTEVNGGASIGSTFFFQLFIICKALVERRRPWMVHYLLHRELPRVGGDYLGFTTVFLDCSRRTHALSHESYFRRAEFRSITSPNQDRKDLIRIRAVMRSSNSRSMSETKQQ
jgi:hypothetical protein